jgi:hypothetical protein
MLAVCDSLIFFWRMPKTTIPEKWLRHASNYHLGMRFEIIPPTLSVGAIEDNERERKLMRAQRDSAEKTSKFGLDTIRSQVQGASC